MSPILKKTNTCCIVLYTDSTHCGTLSSADSIADDEEEDRVPPQPGLSLAIRGMRIRRIRRIRRMESHLRQACH